MRNKIVSFLRQILPSHVSGEERKEMEHVLTVKLAERGQQRMLVCRIVQHRSMRSWGLKFLGTHEYAQTEVVVIDPLQSQKPVYDREYGYIVSKEGAHDAAILALESNHDWYQK